jgi:RNA polymerase sigma factor (TIGR02999 family)
VVSQLLPAGESSALTAHDRESFLQPARNVWNRRLFRPLQDPSEGALSGEQTPTIDDRLMNTTNGGDLSMLVAAAGRDPQALDRLLSIIYDELKRIARYHLRGSAQRETLCTTELVHEAFLKIAAGAPVDWSGRAHFFAAASRAMRQVLVDFARRRGAAKRGGAWSRTTLADDHGSLQVQLDEILALNEALDRLESIEPRLRQVVEYRFFGGMSSEDIAALMGVSVRTVDRDWTKARMLLLRELEPSLSA